MRQFTSFSVHLQGRRGGRMGHQHEKRVLNTSLWRHPNPFARPSIQSCLKWKIKFYECEIRCAKVSSKTKALFGRVAHRNKKRFDLSLNKFLKIREMIDNVIREVLPTPPPLHLMEDLKTFVNIATVHLIQSSHVCSAVCRKVLSKSPPSVANTFQHTRTHAHRRNFSTTADPNFLTQSYLTHLWDITFV